MINTVEKFINKYKIKNKSVVLGFSSGPDSCALALLLNSLKDKYNLKIILAYFNHNWRKEAQEEEFFTKEFAKNLGVDFYIEKAPNNILKSEEIARNLRYDFFSKCAEIYKTDVVFLAHNKNDNIETLIYRIIKGTSTKGLTSIPEKRDIYYRPLLEIEKKDILIFLKENNQNYRLDSSNNDIKYKRNLIRHKILPLFEKINPNYINNINNLIKNSINTKKIIDDKISEIEKKIIKDNIIFKNEYILLSTELRLEILNNYLGDCLKYRDFKNLVKYDNFILNNNDCKTSLNSCLFLKVKKDKIYIEEKKEAKKNQTIILKEGEFEFENIILKIEKKEDKIENFPKNNENYCFLNLDFPIVIRHRKQGDIFSPIGLKGTMKLKDYFINEKIEQSKKDELILIAKEKEIIWILSNRISEKYKVVKKPYYKLSWKEK